jgi:hypothetical protein
MKKRICFSIDEGKELYQQYDHWTGGCRSYFKLKEFLGEK